MEDYNICLFGVCHYFLTPSGLELSISLVHLSFQSNWLSFKMTMGISHEGKYQGRALVKQQMCVSSLYTFLTGTDIPLVKLTCISCACWLTDMAH